MSNHKPVINLTRPGLSIVIRFALRANKIKFAIATNRYRFRIFIVVII